MTYPPKRGEALKLFRELKRLDATTGSEYNARKYEIIHDLAEAHLYDAKSYLVEGLESRDPDYRWACISALATHWRDKDDRIVRKLLEMAEHDPDIQVRMIAIDSLGRSLAIPESLPTIRRVIEDENEDLDLRKIAYISFQSIPGHPPKKALKIDKDLLDALG